MDTQIMITNKKIFFIGILLIIVTLLGLPIYWKFFLIIVSACILIVSSVKLSLPTNLPKQFSRNQFFGEAKESFSDVSAEPVVEKQIEYVNLEKHDDAPPVASVSSKIKKVLRRKVVKGKNIPEIEEEKIVKEIHSHFPTRKRTKKTKTTDILPLQ